MTTFRVSLLLLILALLCARAYALEPVPGPYTPPPTEYLVPPSPRIPVDVAPGGSIGALKYLPDDVSVQVRGKIVSGLVSTDSPVAFYIQEPDRSAGIRVVQEGGITVEAGNIVDIAGTLATANGERVLQATNVVRYVDGNEDPIQVMLYPLAMTHKDMGGGPQGFQSGVVDRAANEDYAVGVNTVGLLVRTWGTVRIVHSQQGWSDSYFYISDAPDEPSDDTCSLHDGSSWGIRVRPAPDVNGQPQVPEANAFVEITGIIGTNLVNGKVMRFLQPRTTDDIVVSPSTMTLTSRTGKITPDAGGTEAVWNTVCFPLPMAVSSPSVSTVMDQPIDNVIGYMCRWDALTQSRAFLEWHTGLRAGMGYWLRAKDYSSISYSAVADDTTDRWISLPYDGFNLMGHPFNHDVLWQDMLVSDGKQTAGLQRASGPLNWIEPEGCTWSPSSQEMVSIGGSSVLQTMTSWRAYNAYAFKPIGLIVPGGVVAPSLPPGPPSGPLPQRGSILATVTDEYSSPIVGARVTCQYGSAVTAVQQDETVSAKLDNLVPGTYVVSASLAQYQSQSKVVDVVADQQTSVSFVLVSNSAVVVAAVADPNWVLPDGESTSTVTVFVTDPEGAPLSNKTVSVTTDLGTFENDSATINPTTNQMGTAECAIKSPADGTANITAACEGVSSDIQVEFVLKSETPNIQGYPPIILPSNKEIRYTIDGTDPTESSPLYDHAGVIVIPHRPLTLKARVFEEGYFPSDVATQYFFIPGGDPGDPGDPHVCQGYLIPPPSVSKLQVTQLGMPGLVQIAWEGHSDEPELFHVHRSDDEGSTWPELTQPANPTSQSYWLDNISSGFEPYKEYRYAVRTAGGIIRWQCQCYEYWLEKEGITESDWIPVKPVTVTVSENQSVDSRVDMRYADGRPLNFQFGGRTYRGGLFVGNAQDGSKIGRSILKFDVPQAETDRLWDAASVSAYHTRSATDDLTDVGLYYTPNGSWTANTATWSTAPDVEVGYCVGTHSVPGGGSSSGWYSWRVHPEWYERHFDAVDRQLSFLLASTNESYLGWAYFAKKEFDQTLAPTLLYAYGAPYLVVDLALDHSQVPGGKTLVGTVQLNHPAPEGGQIVYIRVSSAAAWAPCSVTIPEGERSASFVISTHTSSCTACPQPPWNIDVTAELMDTSTTDAKQFTITAPSY